METPAEAEAKLGKHGGGSGGGGSGGGGSGGGGSGGGGAVTESDDDGGGSVGVGAGSVEQLADEIETTDMISTKMIAKAEAHEADPESKVRYTYCYMDC
jgi:hypothetical protein